MRYCAVEILSGLDRVISPYLTVSVRLRTDRTLRYHNKHHGLLSTVSVHQLWTESVERPVESESVCLVATGTGELLQQLKDCDLTAMAGKPTVHLA